LLPKINLPLYEMRLSDGKSVSFRAFTVAEERLLLMAAQSQDPEEIKNTTLQVARNCLLGNVTVEDLPFYDFSKLMIMLKARSIGETETQSYKCKNMVEDQECGTSFNVLIKYNDVEIENLKNPKGKVFPLGDGISVELKYPTFANVKDTELFTDDWLVALYYLKNNVTAVYQRDNRTPRKEIDGEELEKWIDTFPKSTMDQIYEFYLDMPYMCIKTKVKCPKCEFEHNIENTRFDTDFF
jgi:hypothetical protein